MEERMKCSKWMRKGRNVVGIHEEERLDVVVCGCGEWTTSETPHSAPPSVIHPLKAESRGVTPKTSERRGVAPY
jgi:hypothetical protein